MSSVSAIVNCKSKTSRSFYEINKENHKLLLNQYDYSYTGEANEFSGWQVIAALVNVLDMLNFWFDWIMVGTSYTFKLMQFVAGSFFQGARLQKDKINCATFADTFRKYREKQLAEDPTWTLAKVTPATTILSFCLSYLNVC